jgi:hypothetical protein
MKYNFEGWNFKEWFFGNGKTIKEICKVGIPLMVGWVITYNPLYTTLITLLGKLLLDTVEYYIKE